MRLKRKSFFLMLGILLLFISCGEIQNIEIRGADNFKYKGFKGNHVQFEADIDVFNPSNHKIKVVEMDVKLLVNDMYLGRLQNSEDIVILPHTDGYITVPLSLRITNLFSGMGTINKLYNQHNLKVEVDGYVKARTAFITKKVKINKTTYVDSLKK